MKPLKFWPVGRYPILLIVLFVVFMLVIPVLSAKTHDSAQVPLVLGTFAVIGLILGMFLLSLFNLFFFKAWSRKFCMYKIKNTFFLTAFVFLISCQANGVKEAAFIQKRNIEEKAILTNYLSNEVKNDSIVLLSCPYIFMDGRCLNDVVKDLPGKDFTAEELLSRSAKDTTSWSEGSMPKVKILLAKGLPVKYEAEKWLKIYAKIGGGFFTFSHVLFSKNFDYAIFYTDFNCGNLCGQDRTVLYQKVVLTENHRP
eukprot:gene3268-3722_t